MVRHERRPSQDTTNRVAPGVLVVRLACTACQQVWEPDLADFSTGRTGCHKQQVSSALGNHLHFVAETVTAALGQLSDHMPGSPAEEVQS
jgi:hypothetical protein